MASITNLIRQAILLFVTIGICIGLLLITIVEIASSYLALTYAFQQLGFDSRRLVDDPVFGPYLTGLVGPTTLAELWALLLSVGLAGGAFYLVHELAILLDTMQDLGLIRHGHADGAVEVYQYSAVRSAIKVLLTVLLMGTLFYYDINLFRYRSVAAISATTQVAADIPNWTAVRSRNDGFAMHIIGIGGYANAALCILFSGLLATVTRRIGRRWERFGEAIDAYLPAEGPQEATETSAHASPRDELSTTPIPVAPGASAPLQEPTPQSAGSAAFSIQMPDLGAYIPSAPAAADRRTEESVPVYGGDGESVTLADAKKDPEKYHIDGSNGTVWLRQFFDAVNEPNAA